MYAMSLYCLPAYASVCIITACVTSNKFYNSNKFTACSIRVCNVPVLFTSACKCVHCNSMCDVMRKMI